MARCGLGVVRVAVNVSYRQFLGEDLADTVRAALREYELPGAALELEFTERILIEDAPDTLKTFADLRALGVMLTIDDFGEGYSALNYLRRLPIHGLKLSQLFLQGVPGNKSDVAVCQAVAGIARSLGLGLVAEGSRQRRNGSSCCSSGYRSARDSCSRVACCPMNSRAGCNRPRRQRAASPDACVRDSPDHA
jgi:EAL domain-containing protein (putative c-di-GMP-specific phosphodiesterase class I)